MITRLKNEMAIARKYSNNSITNANWFAEVILQRYNETRNVSRLNFINCFDLNYIKTDCIEYQMLSSMFENFSSKSESLYDKIAKDPYKVGYESGRYFLVNVSSEQLDDVVGLYERCLNTINTKFKKIYDVVLSSDFKRDVLTIVCNSSDINYRDLERYFEISKQDLDKFFYISGHIILDGGVVEHLGSKFFIDLSYCDLSGYKRSDISYSFSIDVSGHVYEFSNPFRRLVAELKG